MSAGLGPAGRIGQFFIDSKLTPLIVLTSILLGVGAVILLPREEEPQIKVPMIDVLVSMPGATAKEVEERVTRPMEKLLWEIQGVEYIYSMSHAGQSVVIVRFKVGEDVPSLNDYDVSSFKAPFRNKQQRVLLYEPPGRINHAGQELAWVFKHLNNKTSTDQ